MVCRKGWMPYPAVPTSSAAPTTAAALPDAATACILKHVPQQQRLTQCALVCKAWASAAVLATADVELKMLESGARAEAFESWLQQHAGQLESLRVSAASFATRPELQLPLNKLQRLQRLELEDILLQLPGEGEVGRGSSGSAREAAAAAASSDKEGSVAAAAPLSMPSSLQHLQLLRVQLVSIGSLLQLTRAAPQLKTLKTRAVSFAEVLVLDHIAAAAAAQQLAAAIPGLLQQLPRLVILELPDMPLSDAAVQQLGKMQQLQEVALAHAHYRPASDLQALPSSITRLCLNQRGSLGSSLPPQLPQLAGLVQLHVVTCDVPATVLAGCTRLQMLHLEHCNLLPAAAADEEFQTAGTAALLDVLPKLAQLQDLQLSLEGLDTVSIAPQRFAALTACSQLTRLVLDPDNCVPLPKGAVQHMFPPGRQLPLLQHLAISPCVDEYSGDDDEWCIDVADVFHIMDCCTGLQWLDVGTMVQPSADLSGLLRLPESCTSLLVGGAAFTDAAAASALAPLTQLKYLCCSQSEGFTDAGLEHLINLELDRLYMYDCSLSDAVSAEGELSLDWDPEKGTVSQQLDELCDLSPVLAPVRLKRQRQQISQLQQEVVGLSLGLARSEAEVTRLKQQLQDANAGQSG